MYRINKLNTQKIARIAKLGENVFHASDLANLWNIQNENTLYTAISRYVKKGILFKIYKGFYSIKPISELDPFFLGTKAIHSYCYVSLETVLFLQGIISQNTDKIVFVGNKTKRFKIGKNSYYCRQLNDKYLYNQEGIIDKGAFKIATVERAVADMLYFNSNAFFDAENLIDWRKVKKMQKSIGYPLTYNRYDFTKPQRCRA